MTIFHICIGFVLFNITGIPQQFKVTPPGTSGFAYPQSVFVDSKDGNIWITDFDNNRLMRFDVSGLSDVNDINSDNLKREYFLGQNYPNPFNPVTYIDFQSRMNDVVTLSVFNILGEKIALLFRGLTDAGKTYKVSFNAENLPGGIYIYVLQGRYGHYVKKMCLLK